MLKNIFDGSLKIMLRSTRPLLPDLDISVIDAAVIKHVQCGTIGPRDKYRCFRRDVRMSETN